MTETPEFKAGEEVEWFEDKYSSIKQYGAIVKVNKKTTRIMDEDGYIHLVKLTQLNWS